MAVEFNRFNNYNNFNLRVDKDAARKAADTKEEQVEAEQTAVFKGLENETDLLTQNAQNLYGLRFNAADIKDKAIADETNKILASLGYKNFKVTPEQVASVANGVSTVILPAMKQVDDAAVAARIEDPNGPFADLFAKEV
jgi:hypothetical protein